jgi:hypothetical protein
MRLSRIADKCRDASVPFLAECWITQRGWRKSIFAEPTDESLGQFIDTLPLVRIKRREVAETLSEDPSLLILFKFDHGLRPIRNASIIESIRFNRITIAALGAFDVHRRIINTDNFQLAIARAATPIVQRNKHFPFSL